MRLAGQYGVEVRFRVLLVLIRNDTTATIRLIDEGEYIGRSPFYFFLFFYTFPLVYSYFNSLYVSI